MISSGRVGKRAGRNPTNLGMPIIVSVSASSYPKEAKEHMEITCIE